LNIVVFNKSWSNWSSWWRN